MLSEEGLTFTAHIEILVIHAYRKDLMIFCTMLKGGYGGNYAWRETKNLLCRSFTREKPTHLKFLKNPFPIKLILELFITPTSNVLIQS
jgi:hypothetical protein